MIFRQFLELRDNFSDLAYNANCFATIAAGFDQATDLQTGEMQIDGYVCRKDANNFKIFRIDIEDGIKVLTEKYSVNIMQVNNHLSDIIDGTSLSVSDFLETASATGDLYSSLGMITQKYSYSNRIALRDLFYQIDNINIIKSLNYNVSDLKQQLMSVSDDSGFISNKTWLAALQGWIESCKDGADNEAVELDNTSPTVLSGLYNVVAPVISATVTAIFSVIGAIFGTIWLIIGQALSNLFTAIISDANESAEFDFDSINDFVKGPVISREESNNAISNVLYNYVSDNRKIMYNDIGSLGFFWWRGDTTSVRMNAYYRPTTSPEAVWNWMKQPTLAAKGVHYSYLNGVYSIYRDSGFVTFEHRPIMSDANRDRMMTDIGYYCACMCMSEFMRWIISTPHKIFDGNDWQDNEIIWSDHAQVISGSTLPANKTCAMIKAAFAMLVGFGRADVGGFPYTDDTIYSAIGRTTVIDVCNEFILQSYNDRNNFSDLKPHYNYDNLDATWQGTHILAYCNPLVTTNCYSTNDQQYQGLNFIRTENTSSVYGWDVASYHMYINSNLVTEADLLPINFYMKFKSLTSEFVQNIIGLTAMVAIASSIVALKVSKAIRLKKLRKQARRSDNINDKKKIYDDYRDPNRAGGPKTPEEINAALDDYVREVDKYNRTGRILGWGSYDIKNGWINDSVAGDSNPILMSSVVDMFQGAANTAASRIATQNNDINDLIGDNNEVLSSLLIGDGSNTVQSLLQYYLFDADNSLLKQLSSKILEIKTLIKS